MISDHVGCLGKTRSEVAPGAILDKYYHAEPLPVELSNINLSL
jgi:hypothetical protein